MRAIKNIHTPVSSLGSKTGNVRHPELLNLIPSLIAYVDKDLHYQYVNSAYEKWIGMKADAIIGRNISEVLGEETLVYIRPHINRVLSGDPVHFGNKMHHRDGVRYLDISLTPDFDEKHHVKGYSVHINDVTEKRRTEIELKDYVETASTGLHWVNAQGIIIWANEAELNMLGYTREEYIGHHISEFHAHQHAIGDILNRLANKETIHQYEAVMVCKDGSTRQVAINSSVLWENGEFIHTRCFTTDITEQKRAALALKESEARYKELMQLLPAAIYTCDSEGRVQLFNQAAVDLWGRAPEAGKDMWCGSWKIFSPINGAPVPLDTCPMAVALKEGRSVVGEEIIVERPDGVRRNVAPNPKPMFDTSGKIIGAVNMLIDVTEQKNAERTIRESEERFRIIANLVPIIIWMTDAEGNCKYVNNRWTEFTGRESQDGYGSKWADWIHPDEREKIILEFAGCIAGSKAFSCKFRYLGANGDYARYQSNAIPRFNEHGALVGYIGVFQNIEQQEQLLSYLENQAAQSKEEFRQSEARYYQMIAEVQDYAVILLSPDGIIQNWNIGAQFIKGYASEEIVGENFSQFYTPEDRNAHLPQKLLEQAAQSGRVTHEGWRVRKDGTRFWGSVAITALHDENNNITGFSKVTRDLTVRKAAEDALKQKNQELEKMNGELEKMNQELTSFAYISSHDLQEPLRKIQTFCSRIVELERGKFSEKGEDYLNRIQTAANRMRVLINDLLTYSRTTAEGKFVLTDLNVLLEDVKNELKETFEDKHAALESSLLPTLSVIPFQFYQLFFNLLSNALKFSKEAVPLRILVKADIVSGDDLPGAGNDPQKVYHHISISDNGIGFEPEYNAKIFEVFQRLHSRDEYEGTGVGLAICRKIVQNHNGMISAEGLANEGATFHIYIPLQDNI